MSSNEALEPEGGLLNGNYQDPISVLSSAVYEYDMGAIMSHEQGTSESVPTIKPPHTRWLTFYKFIFLPFMILGSFTSLGADYYDLKKAGLQLQVSFLDFVPGIITGAFIAILIYGLHKRRLWAWICNWVFLGFKTVVPPITTSRDTGVYIGAVILTALIFLLPNYIYFKKRKHLFT